MLKLEIKCNLQLHLFDNWNARVSSNSTKVQVKSSEWEDGWMHLQNTRKLSSQKSQTSIKFWIENYNASTVQLKQQTNQSDVNRADAIKWSWIRRRSFIQLKTQTLQCNINSVLFFRESPFNRFKHRSPSILVDNKRSLTQSAHAEDFCHCSTTSKIKRETEG